MACTEAVRALDTHARVTTLVDLAPDLFELWLDAPALAGALPGQFVHVRVGEGYLRRPFSVYRTRGSEIALLIRAKGRGTRWLAGREPGDELALLGPLGRPFSPPAAGERLLLVGGGVGVAPLAAYAERHGNAAMTAHVGFRNAAQLAGLAAFRLAGVPVRIHTDDGSAGQAGLVTQGLAAALAGVSRVLCCGPDPLMKAVAAVCAAQAVPCEVSLERPMGCGFGVCLACVVPLRDGGYARACCDGPVFDAAEVAW